MTKETWNNIDIFPTKIKKSGIPLKPHFCKLCQVIKLLDNAIQIKHFIFNGIIFLYKHLVHHFGPYPSHSSKETLYGNLVVTSPLTLFFFHTVVSCWSLNLMPAWERERKREYNFCHLSTTINEIFKFSVESQYPPN